MALLIDKDIDSSTAEGVYHIDPDKKLSDFSGIFWARRWSDSANQYYNHVLKFSHLVRSGGGALTFGPEDSNIEVNFVVLYDNEDGFDVDIWGEK